MNQTAKSRLRRLYLVVTMTRGMSLAAWHTGGHLSREIALYRRLRPHLGGIAIVSHGDASDLNFADQLTDIDILVPGRASGWTGQLLTKRLIQLAAGRQVVLKTNQAPGGELAAEVASALGAPLIARNGYLFAEFIERQRGAEHPEARAARALERHLFEAASRVVVTTAAMQDSVIDSYGVASEKVMIVPNYVDTALFAPGKAEKAVPGRIGFVGRLAPQKNLHALFDGLAGFTGEVVLVGAGELAESLRARAKDENLPVRFRPPMPNEQLPSFLHSCSGFVLPSLYEGHPKTLIEAMSTGLPCVATAVPGIAEMVEHEVDALLCQPDGPSLRAALDRLIAEPELTRRLGQAARSSIESRFALNRIVELECDALAAVSDPEHSRQPSPNGDAPLDRNKRWRYLAHARNQVRAETREQTPAQVYRLKPDAARGARRGDSPLRVYSDAILADALVPLAGSPVAILDVGCGRGHYASFLRERGLTGNYLGIDVQARDDWHRFAGPQEGLAVTFQEGMVETVNLPNAHFDFVFSSSALEHIADDTAAAERIHAATRPGGLGLHLVPAPASILLYGYHGWRRYDADTLRVLFEAVGFEVLGIERLGGLPSFLLHLLWIGTLEAGTTRLILHDWLRRGGPDDHWRSRAGRPWLPRLRTAGWALRGYNAAFSAAQRLDPLLPQPTSGFAVWTRRA